MCLPLVVVRFCALICPASVSLLSSSQPHVPESPMTITRNSSDAFGRAMTWLANIAGRLYDLVESSPYGKRSRPGNTELYNDTRPNASIGFRAAKITLHATNSNAVR